jgi:hypothetical protein
MRGWCLGAMGRPAESMPMVLHGLTSYRATGANVVLSFFLTMLAEVYGMAGQPQEGLNRLAEAVRINEATEKRWVEAARHAVVINE